MEDKEPQLDGAAILREARDYLRRFVIPPSRAALTAATLWPAHTHAFTAFGTSPRLAINAEEPGCAKTKLMELVGWLSANPTMEVDPTGPVIAAIIEQSHPTVLIDETDTIWGTHGGANMRSLRAIINSGYKQGARQSRLAGQSITKRDVFGPMALAGNGVLPETIRQRSVQIIMRKPRDGETYSAYMPRMHAPLGMFIGESLGAWVSSVALELATAWPDLPDGVEGRDAEVWEPLIAIADQAGQEWPELAREACVEMTLGASSEPVQSPGARILKDLRLVWTGERLSTAAIVRRLFDVQGAPWKGMWAPAQAPRELAELLRPYGVTPRKIRDESGNALQGYRLIDLRPVWDRWVPERVPEQNLA